jgi:hypothetical protein
MFHLAVVLESGDVVGGGLDAQDEAEFVVDLDRRRPGLNIADLLLRVAQCSPATLTRQLARLRHLASSNASPALIATISLALVAPPSPPAAASPNTPSFLLSPDKSAHKM